MGNKLSKTAFISVVILLAIIVSDRPMASQQKRHGPPFAMKLLPGYHIKEMQGYDSRTGEISKPGGLSIKYDMPFLPTMEQSKIKPPESWKRECVWRKDRYSQTSVANPDVVCWFDVDQDHPQYRGLHVSFPDGSDFSTRVKNQRQIDLALKMLLSYSPTAPPQ